MKKNGRNNPIEKDHTGTIFDDVFRTMAQKFPELFIPLINEVFHTDYPENEPLRQMRNEHLEKFGKVITDSIFNIRDHCYHIECQSSQDGLMALRMLEYDIAIGLETVDNTGVIPKMLFPESCVLYLREQQNPAEPLRTEIIFPDGQSVVYAIPTVAAQSYTIDDVFSKKLLLLLPYHILCYEKTLKSEHPERERLEQLLDDYRLILKKMEEENTSVDRMALFKALIELMNEIADYCFIKDSDIQKEYHNIMGGNVLQLKVDPLLESLARMKQEWRNEGIKEGRNEGWNEGHDEGWNEGHNEGWNEGHNEGAQTMLLKNVQSVSERIGMSFEEAMNLLNVTDEDREYCREHLPLFGQN